MSVIPARPRRAWNPGTTANIPSPTPHPFKEAQTPNLNTSHEIHLKVLRHLENNPQVTQRELAQHLGISLGKANYCLRGLIDKGWIKANNFKNSNKKAAYVYLLTPSGLEQKAKITVRFLKQRMQEYKLIQREISELKAEIESANSTTNQ